MNSNSKSDSSRVQNAVFYILYLLVVSFFIAYCMDNAPILESEQDNSLVIGGIVLILVYISYYFRNRMPNKISFVSKKIALILITLSIASSLWFYYPISIGRDLASGWPFLAILFCSAGSLLVAYKLSPVNSHISLLKTNRPYMAFVLVSIMIQAQNIYFIYNPTQIALLAGLASQVVASSLLLSAVPGTRQSARVKHKDRELALLTIMSFILYYAYGSNISDNGISLEINLFISVLIIVLNIFAWTNAKSWLLKPLFAIFIALALVGIGYTLLGIAFRSFTF